MVFLTKRNKFKKVIKKFLTLKALMEKKLPVKIVTFSCKFSLDTTNHQLYNLPCQKYHFVRNNVQSQQRNY